MVSAGKSSPAASETDIWVGGGSVLKIVPVASASARDPPAGSLSISRNVSPLSSTSSSMIATDTVFSVSPGAKVSVTDVAV